MAHNLYTPDAELIEARDNLIELLKSIRDKLPKDEHPKYDNWIIELSNPKAFGTLNLKLPERYVEI